MIPAIDKILIDLDKKNEIHPTIAGKSILMMSKIAKFGCELL